MLKQIELHKRQYLKTLLPQGVVEGLEEKLSSQEGNKLKLVCALDEVEKYGALGDWSTHVVGQMC